MCNTSIPIYAKDTPQARFEVYAVLDYFSQGTFICEDLIQMLKSARVLSTDITVKTINGEESMPTIAVDDLAVICTEDFGNHYSEFEIELPKTYTQTELPFGMAEIPSPDKLQGWQHLQPILPYIPKIDPQIPIDLLIGGNCIKALEPCEILPSANDGPCAIRTKLGWCVVGKINSPSTCYFIGNAFNESSCSSPL